jgi:very-short-patch-repair endonuclease
MRFDDQSKIGSYLADVASAAFKMPDHPKVYPDLTSVSLAGMRFDDQSKIGSYLADVASAAFKMPDYPKVYPDLTSVSLAGMRFDDQSKIGSYLVDVASAAFKMPDHPKVYPDLTSVSLAGMRFDDQSKIGSYLADVASAAFKMPDHPKVYPDQARITSDDMQNSEIYEIDLDRDVEIPQILLQVSPTFPRLNKIHLKQILKNNEEAMTRKEIYDVLKLRNLCNDAANLAKGREIFKNTNKASDAIVDICCVFPNDKVSFGNFIDNLYILFYEGAGDDKLRFLKDDGGVLEENECEFIWCVKHLRNKWLRHDPDHGSEKKIRASRDTLRNAFRGLGLSRYPTGPEDFLYLHSKLVKESRKFLEAILEKIKNYDVEKIGE